MIICHKTFFPQYTVVSSFQIGMGGIPGVRQFIQMNGCSSLAHCWEIPEGITTGQILSQVTAIHRQKDKSRQLRHYIERKTAWLLK